MSEKKVVIMMLETITNDYCKKTMLSLIDEGEFDTAEIYTFNRFDEQVQICQCKTAWQEIHKALRNRQIQVTEMDCYGILELLQSLQKEDTIFLSPMDSFQSVAADIALLKPCFNKIYVYRANPNFCGRYTNVDALVGSFLGRTHVGMEGLDRGDACHPHNDGAAIHYTMEGELYREYIPSSRSHKCESGSEGFTFISSLNPMWRVKIWNSTKQQYSVNKTLQMVRDELRHQQIAFPEAIVYNTLEEPIGFVMPHFDGKLLRYGRSRGMFKDNPDGVTRLLESVMFMSSHSILHPDIGNNILIDKGTPYIIDIDSVAYKGYPACSYNINGRRDSYLPKTFLKDSLDYSHVEMTYTLLSMACSAFVEPANLFLNEWDENGLCQVNKTGLSDLKRVCPALSRLFCEAYVKGNPVDIISIYFALTSDEKIEKKEDDFVFEEYMMEGFHRATDPDIVDKRPTKQVILKEPKKPTKIVTLPNGRFPKISDSEYSVEKTEGIPIKKKIEDSSPTILPKKQSRYIPPTEKLNSIDMKEEQKNFIKQLDTKLKEFIITKVDGGTVPMWATLEEAWQNFINRGAWKKPVLLFGSIAVATAAMLIACFFM